MSRTIAVLLLAILTQSLVGQESRPKRERPERGGDAPKIETVAPDFELKTEKGSATIKLSSFRGKKPVALIFGSYT